MNLCECGCGAEVKKRFKQGHWSRVPENNAKIREWLGSWKKKPPFRQKPQFPSPLEY